MTWPGFQRLDVPSQAVPHLRRQPIAPGGVVTMEPGTYRALATGLTRIVTEIARRGSEIARPDPRAAAKLLGLRPESAGLVPPVWSGHPDAVARIDFVLSGGTPRVLEVNFGAALGGTVDIETLGALAEEQAGLTPAGSPHRARVHLAIEACLQHDSPDLYLPLWPWSHITDPAAYFASTRRLLDEQGIGLRTPRLEYFAAQLQASEQPVVILKLFDTLDAVRHGIAMAELGYGSGRGKAVWVLDELAAVLSSKLLLADPGIRAALPPELRDWLPETALLGAGGPLGSSRISANAVAARRGCTVLKPAAEHSGVGVVIGPLVDDAGCRRPRVEAGGGAAVVPTGPDTLRSH